MVQMGRRGGAGRAPEHGLSCEKSTGLAHHSPRDSGLQQGVSWDPGLRLQGPASPAEETPFEVGIRVQIHSQEEPPIIDQLGFGAAPGYQTFVSCQKQQVSSSGPPNQPRRPPPRRPPPPPILSFSPHHLRPYPWNLRPIPGASAPQ